MDISSTIVASGIAFRDFKKHRFDYIKLIPCYDLEYGIVIKMLRPSRYCAVLDKSWIKISPDENNEIFRFRCPSLLFGYLGAKADEYSDAFPDTDEILRLKIPDSGFSELKNQVTIPRKQGYYPYMSSDGKLHVSLAYARNVFPESLRKNIYVSCASTTRTSVVIHREIVVQVICGASLDHGEYAFKLIRKNQEFVSRPLRPILQFVGKYITRFTYGNCMPKTNSLIIYFRECYHHARCKQRTGRHICRTSQRKSRTRRVYHEDGGAGTFDGGKDKILDFKRRGRQPRSGDKRTRIQTNP